MYLPPDHIFLFSYLFLHEGHKRKVDYHTKNFPEKVAKNVDLVHFSIGAFTC